MAKTSLLTFTYNNLSDVLNNHIIQLYDRIDEFIIVDSSKKSILEEFKEKMKELGYLRKIRVFWLPPLGFVEPFRMFGIMKCNGKKIIYLDPDERIIDETLFQEALEKLDEFSCIFTTRVEYINGVYMGESLQARIFSKDSVYFRGIIHESPQIKGKCLKIYKPMIRHDEIENFNKKSIYFIIEILQKGKKLLKEASFLKIQLKYLKRLFLFIGGYLFLPQRKDHFLYSYKRFKDYSLELYKRLLKNKTKIARILKKNNIPSIDDYTNELRLYDEKVWKALSKKLEKNNGIKNFIALLLSYSKYGKEYYKNISKETLYLADILIKELLKSI